MQEKQRAFLVRTAYWAVWTALLWLGVRYLLRWLLPFILALGLAALVEPVIAWCRRRMGLKRGFTAAVVTIAVTAAILALAAVIVWQLIRQAAELLTRLPTLLAGLPGMTAALRAGMTAVAYIGCEMNNNPEYVEKIKKLGVKYIFDNMDELYAWLKS